VPTFRRSIFLFSEQNSYLCSGAICIQSDRNVCTHQTARPHIPKDSDRHENLISPMKYDANNLSVFVKFSIRCSLNLQGLTSNERKKYGCQQNNKLISDTSVCSTGHFFTVNRVVCCRLSVYRTELRAQCTGQYHGNPCMRVYH